VAKALPSSPSGTRPAPEGRAGRADLPPSGFAVDADHAFLSSPLGNRFQLVALGENLTNTLVMAGIGGDGSIERATPRTLWTGLRLR